MAQENFDQQSQPTQPIQPVQPAQSQAQPQTAWQSAQAQQYRNANYQQTTPMPAMPAQPASPFAPQYAQASYANGAMPAQPGMQQPMQGAQPMGVYPGMQGAQRASQPGAPLQGQGAQAQQGAAGAQRTRNNFADPANAYGTEASVTASGVAANAQTFAQIASKNRKTTIITAVSSAAIAALLIAGAGMFALREGWVTSNVHESSVSSISTSTGGTGTTSVSGNAVNWTTVAKKVAPSVVTIEGNTSDGAVTGSGAILNKEGYVVTNNHVVSGTTDLQVTLSNGNIYKAKVVGTDPSTDLAVIQIQDAPSNLTPVTFVDNSDNLAVGESVMAVGSPLGLQNTATTGVVSALERPVAVSGDDSETTVVTNSIQVDAAINSGNSGGPLFNAAGQLIGINSSISTTSNSTGSIGIGYAIPANLVKWVSNDLAKNGKVTHVVLGVTVQTDTATADGVTRAGAEVKSVTSGGAAAKAGIQNGDTIIAYNKKTVESTQALLGYVRATQKGEKVTLTVIRDGKTVDITVEMNTEEPSSVSSNLQNNRNNQRNNNDENNDDESNPFGELFGNNN